MCNSTETASRPDAASNVCAKCAATARNVNTHCVRCNARFYALDQLYCHKCGRNQKTAEGTQNHTTYGNSSEVTKSSKLAVPGTRTSQPSALSLTHEEKRDASPGEGNENSLAISHCFDYKPRLPPVMGEDGYNEDNTSDPVQPTSSDGSLQVCTLCSMHEFTTWW